MQPKNSTITIHIGCMVVVYLILPVMYEDLMFDKIISVGFVYVVIVLKAIFLITCLIVFICNLYSKINKLSADYLKLLN